MSKRKKIKAKLEVVKVQHNVFNSYIATATVTRRHAPMFETRRMFHGQDELEAWMKAKKAIDKGKWKWTIKK